MSHYKEKIIFYLSNSKAPQLIGIALLWYSCILCFSTKILMAQERQLSNPDIRKGEECRVKLETLKPIISFNNPFFYNHSFDQQSLIEIANLSPERLVTIEQFGCLRHHAQISLKFSKEIAYTENLNFYANELFMLLDRIHYADPYYPNYREDLENSLAKQIQSKGINNKITIPLLEFNYVLYIESSKASMNIIIEIVRYVHEQNVNLPGIKDYLDDGYFKELPQK